MRVLGGNNVAFKDEEKATLTDIPKALNEFILCFDSRLVVCHLFGTLNSIQESKNMHTN